MNILRLYRYAISSIQFCTEILKILERSNRFLRLLLWHRQHCRYCRSNHLFFTSHPRHPNHLLIHLSTNPTNLLLAVAPANLPLELRPTNKAVLATDHFGASVALSIDSDAKIDIAGLLDESAAFRLVPSYRRRRRWPRWRVMADWCEG